MATKSGVVEEKDIRNGKTFWQPVKLDFGGYTEARLRVHGRPFIDPEYLGLPDYARKVFSAKVSYMLNGMLVEYNHRIQIGDNGQVRLTYANRSQLRRSLSMHKQ